MLQRHTITKFSPYTVLNCCQMLRIPWSTQCNWTFPLFFPGWLFPPLNCYFPSNLGWLIPTYLLRKNLPVRSPAPGRQPQALSMPHWTKYITSLLPQYLLTPFTYHIINYLFTVYLTPNSLWAPTGSTYELFLWSQCIADVIYSNNLIKLSSMNEVYNGLKDTNGTVVWGKAFKQLARNIWGIKTHVPIWKTSQDMLLREKRKVQNNVYSKLSF